MELKLKRLGYGAFRQVFVINENYVFKIETDGDWMNIMEAKLWNFVKYTPDLAKWFAPVRFISEDGKILIMDKVDVNKKKYPKKIPAFFTDLKMSNFGWIGDRFVCCDYSSDLIFARLYDKMNKFQTVKKWKDW